MSRVRAESQGFGTYNNHRALGQIKMDKDFHCSRLWSNGLQGCVPLSGLFIVSAQVLKSTPSAPPPPASFLLQMLNIFLCLNCYYADCNQTH